VRPICSRACDTGSYARQSCSWNAASGGTKTNSSSLTFTTAGSVAVTHFGTQSSATYGAGSYAIGGAFTSTVTAASITIAAVHCRSAPPDRILGQRSRVRGSGAHGGDLR
jgi:hypothetical protein